MDIFALKGELAAADISGLGKKKFSRLNGILLSIDDGDTAGGKEIFQFIGGDKTELSSGDSGKFIVAVKQPCTEDKRQALSHRIAPKSVEILKNRGEFPKRRYTKNVII